MGATLSVFPSYFLFWQKICHALPSGQDPRLGHFPLPLLPLPEFLNKAAFGDHHIGFFWYPFLIWE
jgi:hypothetical protein